MSRAVTLVGYAVLAGALAIHEVAARTARRRGRLPRPMTLGELLAAAKRTRITWWALLAAWLWLGWHVFARA
jgi:Family of unknown function (DUF6186)